MDKEKHKIIYSWKFWFTFLSISICVVILITSIPKFKANRIVTLASTSPQDANQNSEPTDDTNTQSNSAPAAPQPTTSSTHAVTQAAVKLGIFSCLKRIDQVSTFLTANAKSGILLLPSKNQPDQHIFSTSLEILPPDNSTIYASASFFPNSDAVYDTVQYVDKSSEELQKTVFKNITKKSILKKNIILLDGGAVKVFLMPAGKGTVVIKKEIVQ